LSPNLQARTVIEFVIEASGEVGEAKVLEATTKDPNAAKCIIEAVKGWRFPQPEDGKPVTVIYPFNLSPG
jgi:outer membrane biosynthesis protein TonB